MGFNFIVYTRNQPTQVLVCGTGSPGELLFTAIPMQLTKDPTFLVLKPVLQS